jgi:hypothetical protein
MFHVRGGTYARDALPGFPMLDPITGALFLVGLAMRASRSSWLRRWRCDAPPPHRDRSESATPMAPLRLLLSWPLVMALGGVLSTSGEGPPYPYRVLSLAPWACLVASIGGIALWDFARSRLPPLIRRAAVAVALLAIVAINAYVLFVAGPRDPGTQRVYGTAATRFGLWLATHRGDRPVVVLPGSLDAPPLPPSYRYAAANRGNFFRPVDELAAIQLASGLYRRHPRRALDPLRPGGDVDLVPDLPPRLTTPALLVLPPAREPEAAHRFQLLRRWQLRHRDGPPLALVLLAAP